MNPLSSKNLQHKLTRNLTLLKWLQIDEVLFASAVLIAYELHVVGLSLSQVLIGEAIFALTILLFEIPTGVFSDLVSRKKTLLIAQLLLIVSVAILAFAQTFAHVILVQILWGIAASTYSGTDAAILYDSLSSLKREQEYRLVLGRITAFGLIAIAIGQVSSGLIGSFSLHLTLILCIPIPIAKFILILLLEEPPREQAASHTPWIHAGKSLRYILGHRTILLLMVTGMFLALGWKTSTHTFNPYFELINLPIVYWGIALAAFNLLAASVSRKAHLIFERLGELRSLALIFGIFIAGYVLMAVLRTPWAALVLLFIWIANPLQKIFISEELNKRTASHQRATVLSMASFCAQGLQVLALPAIGYLIDLYDLQTMYLLFAILLAIVGLGALVGLRHLLQHEKPLTFEPQASPLIP